MMKKMMLIASVCFSFAAHSDGSVDESSFATMIEAMQEQMAQLKDDMNKKDETIAALKAKTEHRQVQLTAGGEVMQLVSEADFMELAARVAACEKTNADQEAKLGMTMDTLSKVRKEIKDGRVGAPPALPPSPPPLPPPRPVAKPGRQLSSSSNGNFVNELSITGSNAVVSWNSHTPGLTSFNCTGVGDGKLTCSGEIHASDFFVGGNSLIALASKIDAVAANVSDVMANIDRVEQRTGLEYLPRTATCTSACLTGPFLSGSTAKSNHAACYVHCQNTNGATGYQYNIRSSGNCYCFTHGGSLTDFIAANYHSNVNCVTCSL